MEDERIFLRKRLTELADQCCTERRYRYSDFLSLYGLSIFHEMEQELSFAEPSVFGGCDSCERCMVRFGSEDLCGYGEEYPIRILGIRPAMAKYAKKLSHRDFLGSVIGLGLEREKIGDIFVSDNEACIFVHESVADYIDLLRRRYLVNGKGLMDLLTPGQFVNDEGKRYASDKGYEGKIQYLRNLILKKFPDLA